MLVLQFRIGLVLGSSRWSFCLRKFCEDLDVSLPLRSERYSHLCWCSHARRNAVYICYSHLFLCFAYALYYRSCAHLMNSMSSLGGLSCGLHESFRLIEIVRVNRQSFALSTKRFDTLMPTSRLRSIVLSHLLSSTDNRFTGTPHFGVLFSWFSYFLHCFAF